jgi:hypothetical protein
LVLRDIMRVVACKKMKKCSQHFWQHSKHCVPLHSRVQASIQSTINWKIMKNRVFCMFLAVAILNCRWTGVSRCGTGTRLVEGFVQGRICGFHRRASVAGVQDVYGVGRHHPQCVKSSFEVVPRHDCPKQLWNHPMWYGKACVLPRPCLRSQMLSLFVFDALRYSICWLLTSVVPFWKRTQRCGRDIPNAIRSLGRYPGLAYPVNYVCSTRAMTISVASDQMCAWNILVLLAYKGIVVNT